MPLAPLNGAFSLQAKAGGGGGMHHMMSVTANSRPCGTVLQDHWRSGHDT
jgi:hypothetical protein